MDEFRFVVMPIRKTWHRVRPAKMFFVDGADSESTLTHLSNSLPDMRITESVDAVEGVRERCHLCLRTILILIESHVPMPCCWRLAGCHPDREDIVVQYDQVQTRLDDFGGCCARGDLHSGVLYWLSCPPKAPPPPCT